MAKRPEDRLPPPRWTDERLEGDRQKAISNFREERFKEPLELYAKQFDLARSAVEDLLEETVDLSQILNSALDMLTSAERRRAFRYIAGPPISDDDLEVMAESTFALKTLKEDPEKVKSVVSTVIASLDRDRFPWVAEQREPTEMERHAAIVASAALIAYQRTATIRRNSGKSDQEGFVRETLTAYEFKEVPTRPVATIEAAPKAGEFCMESMFGTRKSDLLIGLWDGRTMPLECKVSNSAVNSIKRLTNDAAVKAKIWIEEHGNLNVVPASVLSGVIGLKHLRKAQADGLTLFWAHDLAAMMEWIESTR